MTRPTTVWNLASRRHALRGATLVATPYRPGDPEAPDLCLFCSKPLGEVYSPSERALAYTADRISWVCMACFCEHKDDFDWPTSE